MKFTGEKKQVGHLDNLDTLPFEPINIRLKKCPSLVSKFLKTVKLGHFFGKLSKFLKCPSKKSKTWTL